MAALSSYFGRYEISFELFLLHIDFIPQQSRAILNPLCGGTTTSLFKFRYQKHHFTGNTLHTISQKMSEVPIP